VDSDDRPLAVIETTQVRVVRFDEIDLEFARDEGEGFETIDDWRQAHTRFWEGDEMRAALGRPDFRVGPGTLVVVERFRLVETIRQVI
jgi:uncharacterized protein YhfF